MMNDFHYPLGQGKLNEDTANCRAKQSGMMGRNAGPASLSLSPSLSVSLLSWKKGALLRLWACDLPLLPTLLPAGVHWLSINQELLTAETTLSHQHAISRVTDSIQTTLHSHFKQSCSPLCFLIPLTLSSSLSLCHILNFLEIQTHPGRVRVKTKAGIIIRSPSLPSIQWWGGGAIRGLGRKCFQKQPCQEFQWWKLMSKMVGLSMLASVTTAKPCSHADMPIQFKKASHS